MKFFKKILDLFKIKSKIRQNSDITIDESMMIKPVLEETSPCKVEEVSDMPKVKKKVFRNRRPRNKKISENQIFKTEEKPNKSVKKGE
jgi:hypothetical protein